MRTNVAQNDRVKHPDPDLRVVGALTRVYERKMSSNDWEFYLRGGGGNASADGQSKHQNRSTVTSMTLQITVQGTDGVTVRGGIASYRVDVIKNEVDHSYSLYLGGNGISRGNNVTLQSDAGEGIRSALAAALITTLGNTLGVGWYRCSPIFSEDAELDARMKEKLNRMPQADLERQVKHALFLAGKPMEMNGPQLTPKDRDMIVEEMQRRSFNFANRDQLEAFAFRLDKEIDIDRAAEIVDKRMSAIARVRAEAEQKRLTEEAKRRTEEAQWNLGPAQFGWANATPMLLLDLTRVKEAEARERLLAAARNCAACSEVEANTDWTVAAIRLPMGKDATDADLRGTVQQALRRTGLKIDLSWTGTPRQRLCVFSK